MSLKTDLITLLDGTFGGNVYPLIAPYGTPAPYAVFTRINAAEDVTLDTNGGTGNPIATRLQIDVYAASDPQAEALATTVKGLLKTWSVENVVNAEQDFYEPDTKLYRVMLDLNAWHY